MKVKELIELLQDENEDDEIIFHNCLKGDDMYFVAISVSDDNSEVYVNIR